MTGERRPIPAEVNSRSSTVEVGDQTLPESKKRTPSRSRHSAAQRVAVGVEQHRIEGTPVRICCPAKTVADCFKYRNKIGLDVALEALRDCWRERKCSMDDLWRYAKICRVANVIRPYLASLKYAS